MAKASKNNKKKSNLLLICFWILIFVLITLLFFIKRNDIKKNLDETNFFERVLGKTPVQNVLKEKKDNTKNPEKIEIDLNEKASSSENYSEVTGTEANKTKPEEIQNLTQNSQKEEKDQTSENKNAKDKTEEAEKEVLNTKKDSEAKSQSEKKTEMTAVPKSTEVTLYFVAIDSDGSVNRKAVKRTLSKSDSPLTDSINTLLKGTTLNEQEKGLLTLIPEGTKLLGASVKNGTATLNFNESFQFNSVGVEGYIAQLMQIVYTATEFSTVRNVQILIEGEKKDYLGSEGQWIGSPLARSSF